MRQKIIDTAISLAQEHGIKFTLEDIAAQASISKKTIYKYFDGKESLINAAVDYIFADIHKQHEDILSLDISETEKLRKIACVYPSVIRFDSLKLDKLIELHPDIYRRIEKHLRDNWELTLELFDRCVGEGSLKNIDREYFRMILLGIFEQTLCAENPEQATKACIDAVFFGFVKSKENEV